MTISQASKQLGISPLSLRTAFQRGDLKEFGTAYRSVSGKHWRYLVNEQKVNEFTKGKADETN